MHCAEARHSTALVKIVQFLDTMPERFRAEAKLIYSGGSLFLSNGG